MVHADRRSQSKFRKLVAAQRWSGLRGGMSRVVTCADNAATQSFRELLQKNVLNRQTRATPGTCGSRVSPRSSALTTRPTAKHAQVG